MARAGKEELMGSLKSRRTTRHHDIETVQQQIAKLMMLGMPLKHAAHYAGVPYQTVYCWMSKGQKQKSGRHRDFFLTVQQADASCMRMLLATGLDIAKKKKDVKMITFLLSSKWPDIFSPSQKTDSQNTNINVPVDMSEQERERVGAQLDKSFPPVDEDVFFDSANPDD